MRKYDARDEEESWSLEEPIGTFDMLDFQSLDCWKNARELRISISRLILSFPKEEKFDLISQIRRSSRSVCSNIAEGYGRFHIKENMQFCRQARGSLTETFDHLLTAYDEGYIGQSELDSFKNSISNTGRILNGYIRFLQKQLNSIQSENKQNKSAKK